MTTIVRTHGAVYEFPGHMVDVVEMLDAFAVWGSIVFSAHDTLRQRRVVLKATGIEKQPKQQRAEIVLLALLKHDHILELYGIVQKSDDIYSVVEPMMCTVEDYLKSLHHVPMGHVQAILKQVVQALAYLHAAGINHANLQPGTIGFNGDGMVKIWGMCHHNVAHPHYGGRRNQNYMSPELLMNFSYNDETSASDMWTLGIIMVEMMTGKIPFVERNNFAHVMKMVEMLGLPPLGILTAHQLHFLVARANLPEQFLTSNAPFLALLEQFDIPPSPALDVILGLVVMDSAARLRADQVLALPFFHEEGEDVLQPPPPPQLDATALEACWKRTFFIFYFFIVLNSSIFIGLLGHWTPATHTYVANVHTPIMATLLCAQRFVVVLPPELWEEIFGFWSLVNV